MGRFRRGTVVGRTAIRGGVCAARYRRRRKMTTGVCAGVAIRSKLGLKDRMGRVQTITRIWIGGLRLSGGSASGAFNADMSGSSVHLTRGWGTAFGIQGCRAWDLPGSIVFE